VAVLGTNQTITSVMIYHRGASLSEHHTYWGKPERAPH